MVAILRILVGVAKKNRRNQGARRLIFHSPSGCRVYRKRSCSRLGRPCQNSILVGVTAYPPQLSGLSTSFPIHRAASLTKDRINAFCLLSVDFAEKFVRQSGFYKDASGSIHPILPVKLSSLFLLYVFVFRERARQKRGR